MWASEEFHVVDLKRLVVLWIYSAKKASWTRYTCFTLKVTELSATLMGVNGNFCMCYFVLLDLVQVANGLKPGIGHWRCIAQLTFFVKYMWKIVHAVLTGLWITCDACDVSKLIFFCFNASKCTLKSVYLDTLCLMSWNCSGCCRNWRW